MSVHQCHGLCNKLQKWMAKNMPHISCSHHSRSQLTTEPYNKTSFEGLLRKYPQFSTVKDIKNNDSKGMKRSFESRVQKYSDQAGDKSMKRASIYSSISSIVKQYIKNGTKQSRQSIDNNKVQNSPLIEQEKPILKKIKLNSSFSNKFNALSKNQIQNRSINKCNDENSSMLQNQYKEPFWKQSSKLLQDDGKKLFKMNVGKKINFTKGVDSQNIQMTTIYSNDNEQKKLQGQGQFTEKCLNENERKQEEISQSDGFLLCSTSNQNKITFNCNVSGQEFKNENDQLMILGFDGQNILEQRNDPDQQEQFQFQFLNNTAIIYQEVQSQHRSDERKQALPQIQEVYECPQPLNSVSQQKDIEIFEKQLFSDEKKDINEQKHLKELDQDNYECKQQNKVDGQQLSKQISLLVENSENEKLLTMQSESAQRQQVLVEQNIMSTNNLALIIEEQPLKIQIKSQKPEIEYRSQVIGSNATKSLPKAKTSSKPIKLKQNILTRSKQQHLNLFNKLSMRLVRKKYGYELSNSQLANKILQNESHNIKLKAFLSNQYNQYRKTLFDFNQLTQEQMRHILLKYFDQEAQKLTNAQ